MTFLEKLNQIEKQIDKIKTVNANVLRSNRISILESDLIKQHLRDLYEFYNELDQLNSKKTENVVEEMIEPKIEKPKEEVHIKEVKEEIVIQPIVVESIVEAPIKKEVVEPDVVISKPADLPIFEEAPKIEAVNTKVEIPKVIEPAKESLKIPEEEDGMSLFEKYQKTTPQKEINLKTNTSKSLKQLISLNDKFIIIKELFGNVISNYDAMINEVDNMKSIDEAKRYMELNVWNTNELRAKEEIIARVEILLERKFMEVK